MMKYHNPELKLSGKDLTGLVSWQSPSNIALVKYWGKFGVQLPCNPSLSITLDQAYTKTEISWRSKKTSGISLEYFFENERKELFEQKITGYMESLIPVFPFLEQLHLVINSLNSFPHSAGIASSASSMSALALCLCSLEHDIFGTLNQEEAFYEKASYVARLGSGSACRSVYGGLSVWGESETIPGSSNEYAVEFPHPVHSKFQNLQDTILIVSSEEKTVSSREGHALMNNHPFAEQRFKQAISNLTDLSDVLQQGDWEGFVRITENEALSLHAMMMTGNPGYMLFHPNSLRIIEEINEIRQQSDILLCFTLDAGPNIHLIYPESEKERVNEFVIQRLFAYCEKGKVILDKAGKGPFRIH